MDRKQIFVRGERFSAKGHREILEGNTIILYLEYGDYITVIVGYVTVCICQNLQNCTGKGGHFTVFKSYVNFFF